MSSTSNNINKVTEEIDSTSGDDGGEQEISPKRRLEEPQIPSSCLPADWYEAAQDISGPVITLSALNEINDGALAPLTKDSITPEKNMNFTHRMANIEKRYNAPTFKWTDIKLHYPYKVVGGREVETKKYGRRVIICCEDQNKYFNLWPPERYNKEMNNDDVRMLGVLRPILIYNGQDEGSKVHLINLNFNKSTNAPTQPDSTSTEPRDSYDSWARRHSTFTQRAPSNHPVYEEPLVPDPSGPEWQEWYTNTLRVQPTWTLNHPTLPERYPGNPHSSVLPEVPEVPFRVLTVKEINAKYGRTILATLEEVYNPQKEKIQLLFPKRYVDKIDWDDKDKINETHPKILYNKTNGKLDFNFE